jgi:hypothetical protein
MGFAAATQAELLNCQMPVFPKRQNLAGRAGPVVGCLACQFDRQVYGIEIEFAWTRRRPKAVR